MFKIEPWMLLLSPLLLGLGAVEACVCKVCDVDEDSPTEDVSVVCSGTVLP